jgi:hypothetical protein
MMMEKHSHKKFGLAIVFLAVVAITFLVATAGVLNELNRTQNSLLLVGSELKAAETQWADVKAELATVEAELATVEAELATVEIELNTSKQLVESLNATLSNLQVNYERLTTGYGYVLRDPSYQEMREFLARDKTDEREYIIGKYVCRHFAADVKANAAKERIWSAYVHITMPGPGHAIVAFLTTDRGLVFIEPQLDAIANPVIGKSYWESVGRPRPTDYDDTVIRIIKYW